MKKVILFLVLLIAGMACFIGIETLTKVNNFIEPEKQKQIQFLNAPGFFRENAYLQP